MKPLWHALGLIVAVCVALATTFWIIGLTFRAFRWMVASWQ